jgi:16S rRNA (cytidine1402-2'-O)-methyltransferase
VLFETGPRLAACLADLASRLGAREAAICRELTKIYEEVRRGDLPTLARSYAEAPAPRGEIAIVIAPPAPDAAPGPEEVDALLHAALAHASVKDAVNETAEITGLPRREIYRRALALNKGRRDD